MKTRIEIMLLNMEEFFKYWLMYTVALVIWIISIIMIATIVLIPVWLTSRKMNEWFEKPIEKAGEVASDWILK